VGSNSKAGTIAMPQAGLHDGSTIAVEVHGDGPSVLLPVNPQPVEGPQAEQVRRWGADPALGRSLIDGLTDAFQVVAFDYEGRVLQVPKPDTLTPANLAGDLLAVADAAGTDRFAFYGYSWLALSGLQLAIRTERLTARRTGSPWLASTGARGAGPHPGHAGRPCLADPAPLARRQAGQVSRGLDGSEVNGPHLVVLVRTWHPVRQRYATVAVARISWHWRRAPGAWSMRARSPGV
jgi:pimeloyl-ACP methyl ester carboxylesterase